METGTTQLTPRIPWAEDGTAEFVGRWRIVSRVMRSDRIERVAWWIEDMPDWARRAQNHYAGEVVRWNGHGLNALRRDAQTIVCRAIDRGYITHTDNEWRTT